MENLIKHKLENLNAIIDSLGTVAVAFSGGVDSTFLLKTAHSRLGRGVIAVTASTPLIPPDEIEAARAFTKAEGISHEILSINIFTNTAVIANPPDRCYHCKLDVFRAIIEFAASQGIGTVADGSNFDDRSDYRPGARAVVELGVRSPLMEAGLTKQEIREASREIGIAAWDKPANPCLATRIPCGTAITKEKLEAVYRAEQHLHGIGLRNVRVRHHGAIARIEAPRESLAFIIEKEVSAGIARAFKTIGFTYITLDIEGYRMGSMNEPMGKENNNGQG